MLDGRVLGASQVEYKPFGKPPLKREIPTLLSHRSRFSDFAFLPEKPITGPAPKVWERCCPRSIAPRVFFFTTHTPSRQSWRGRRIAHSILAWQQDCPKTHHRAPEVRQRGCPRHTADRVFFTTHTPIRQSWRGHRIAPSILLWQQDCFNHSCADNRIAPVHYEQLGLGTVLPRA